MRVRMEVVPNNIDEEKEEEEEDNKYGGWITFPFIIGTLTGLTLSIGGCTANLIVFLVKEFNVKSIEATQIYNVLLGCASLFPLVAAVVSDSFSGCFFAITLFSLGSFLGSILLTLIATVHSLRPWTCRKMGSSSNCEAPSPSVVQYAVLYTALALVSVGQGGTRFLIATMGADQLKKKNPKDQGTFFNWYFFTLCINNIISSTVLVYVEDNVGWGLGFGISAAAGAIALLIFLLGKPFYRLLKPQGSPFTSISRVLVAAFWKRKMFGPSETHQCYLYHGMPPTSSLRFLNRAALKEEGDTRSDSSYSRSWRVCTGEEVEDLKALIKIIPILCAGIFLGTPIVICTSLSVLQALSMDRSLGPYFKIPPSSFMVFVLLASATSLSFIDRYLLPKWQNLTRKPLTPLQRIGIGHVFNILSMVGSTLVEARRLHVVRDHHLMGRPESTVPMSALWLIGPLALMGLGEAFHFPGQVAFNYQEFPASLRSTSTAMTSLVIAISFYLSTMLIDLVRRITRWLPDNINDGRLDNVYWMLAVIGTVNFVYFLICAKLFTYKNAI